MLDFAATFGTIAIARAYADWSTPINASYRGQLIDRAVDLVQLFPLSATKNGADIRLSVDAVEDMFRIEDLTHIVIVAGDSDYVALAQKAKRLGRYVVGIGVAGGTSRALTASCDEYADYDALLATDAAVERRRGGRRLSRRRHPAARRRRPGGPDAVPGRPSDADAAASRPRLPRPPRRTPRASRGACRSRGRRRRAVRSSPTARRRAPASGTRNPGRLILKALELLRAKNDEEWQPSGRSRTRCSAWTRRSRSGSWGSARSATS